MLLSEVEAAAAPGVALVAEEIQAPEAVVVPGAVVAGGMTVAATAVILVPGQEQRDRHR